MSPKLTVAAVVPVYNEVTVLSEAISRLSLLGFDELVIVDGGSIDGTLQLLQDSGVRWILSEPGRAKQMNAGFKECRSDIILFVHGDTFIPSGSVEALIQALNKPDVVGGRFDVSLSGSHPLYRLIERLINFRSRISKISTGDQCIFVRRELFEKMGGFADIPLMEDVEFSRRLKRQGSIVCLRERVVTSSRRWEQNGIMRTVLLMWRLRLLYWLGVSPLALAAMYRSLR